MSHSIFPGEGETDPQVHAGFRINAEPLPPGYREKYDDLSDYQGDYERIAGFLGRLTAEELEAFVTISVISANPPDQEAMGLAMFGFSIGEHTTYLARGVLAADPNGEYEEARQPIIRQLGQLHIYHRLMQRDDGPELRVVRSYAPGARRSSMPDAGELMWDKVPRTHKASRDLRVNSDYRYLVRATSYALDPTSDPEFPYIIAPSDTEY